MTFEDDFKKAREYDLLGLTPNESKIIKNIVKYNCLDKQRVKEAIELCSHRNKDNKDVIIIAEFIKELRLK